MRISIIREDECAASNTIVEDVTSLINEVIDGLVSGNKMTIQKVSMEAVEPSVLQRRSSE